MPSTGQQHHVYVGFSMNQRRPHNVCELAAARGQPARDKAKLVLIWSCETHGPGDRQTWCCKQCPLLRRCAVSPRAMQQRSDIEVLHAAPAAAAAAAAAAFVSCPLQPTARPPDTGCSFRIYTFFHLILHSLPPGCICSYLGTMFSGTSHRCCPTGATLTRSLCAVSGVTSTDSCLKLEPYSCKESLVRLTCVV
jgi:hypothetical protein